MKTARVLKKRMIKVTAVHLQAAKQGAGNNVLAKAINDNLRAGFVSTVTMNAIRIWPQGFKGNSVFDCDLPNCFDNRSPRQFTESLIGITEDDLPFEFEIDIPEEYHRRQGRNLEEDFRFIAEHGE